MRFPDVCRSAPASLVVAWLLLAAAEVEPARAQRATAGPLDVDAFVERVMTAFDVPGLALAVVKDGRVVAARGYGVRKLGESARVDAQTLFGIASNTKVFTAIALGCSSKRASSSGMRPLCATSRGFRCGIRT